ncbi:nitrate- and nitrite sensing domain-containing protein [Streptomyces sp. DSM 42041]|uniref:histidine kinase n=1 Tax=Streptomyces hazeniae TaxID=3075538 RepID=A0ABU2NW85_9ACTN|nr:nitrate- and nitrite sensing domain-containing protein [Streptomyces sp. DSM 42041]MDT0381245.1 nitrate- and nitrite sensing domain-containing protein [Streptomyces sp. DSM 42041]
MRFRGKSIRRKIVALLLVPLVSLVSIWAFATYLTGREAFHLRATATSMDALNDPLLEVVHALQGERRQVMVHLADPRRSDALNRFGRAQRATDRAVGGLRATAGRDDVRGDLQHDTHDRLDAVLRGLDGLGELRRKAGNNTLTRGGAFQGYNDLVGPSFTLLTSLHGLHEEHLEQEGNALVGVARAREYLAREDALLAAAIAAGEMTSGDRRAFSDRIAERNLALETSLQQLPAEDREAFQEYWTTTDGRTLRSYEDAVIAAGSGGATEVVNAQRWQQATATVLDDLEDLRAQSHHRYDERIRPAATEVWLRAGAAGVLGLAAVVASLVVSARVGRGLVRDLSTLRRQANESAGVRLPSVMRRLAAGDQVDVETEAPRLEFPPDETGQVGQALNTLQRAAVEAAVKQAEMRRGVSEVFVNLARRNQVLLHRQLTLLDTMERRTEDADELADLFRLDHLTTRMRRHAEGLVILSGVAPSRQWRKPVQLMDVVRAAVAEVEAYERIEVRRLARLAVDGGAVADLTHLIAELLENATVFSPPHTGVQVLGERVANGFTLEIHDRGLGMPADALLDANLRLAETPEFELSDTDRLGLFVVSRLAQRQGVRVSLQPSPYGGTTAVVLIPASVLSEPTGREGGPETAAVANGRRPRPRAPLSPAGTDSGPLDGPVELEAALADLDSPDSGGGLFRRPERPGSQDAEHQQAAEDPGAVREDPPAGGYGTAPEAAPGTVPDGGPAPDPAGLPRRRRRTPVLVSDNGRRVEDGPGGLPRRVRQASLAPQLKEVPAPEADRSAGQGSEPDDRDAEEVRSRMAALQRGWQRGREETDTPPGGTPAADPAPETDHPEGEGR